MQNVQSHRNHRSLVARLLCGILPLGVETGRYKDIKKELRFCKICEGSEIEDEIHFIFVCPVFEDARERLIDPLLRNNPEKDTMSKCEKLQWLLHKSRIKEFGAALAGLYQCRQDYLYK